jgi:hypothetical protein
LEGTAAMAGLFELGIATLVSCGTPWADTVVSFDPGQGGSPGYDHPLATLGPPERFTGEGTSTPMVVSAFSPAWAPNEIVSIGLGGSLTVSFAAPIQNDPQNLWGIDLIVFGNAGLTDMAYPAGICGGLFGGDGGVIELSEDGASWITVPATDADGLWPTVGWIDAGPYDAAPGAQPTDPTIPVDPTLTLGEVNGLTHNQLLARYERSAGGTGIDIGLLGIDAVRFVRFTVPPDAFLAIEIDAIVDAGPNTDPNGDRVVGVDDLLIVIAGWDQSNHAGDVNHDGTVNVNDLLVILEAWE